MSIWKCKICGYIYDDSKEQVKFVDLPATWTCPKCGAPKDLFEKVEETPVVEKKTAEKYLGDYERDNDTVETLMKDIHEMAETGTSLSSAMGTSISKVSWNDILLLGSQLNPMPLDEHAEVSLKTIIGKHAKKPMVLDLPVYVSHMSFGALSKEAKEALARGSAQAKTAICSGEGGILAEEKSNAYKYIFEYIPNLYSVTPKNLKTSDAIEIKIGQGTKPGMGGHLPGAKVTPEIAKIRGKKEGEDIISPSRFPGINTKDDLKNLVTKLRTESLGRPIGIKIAAGNIEADLDFVCYAEPDFITIDGRGGATGSSPKAIKDATSVPTIYALSRARKYLDEHNLDIDLVITGGLRIASDFAKALAMGADAIAIATSSLIAIGCQQYRLCNLGNCPIGIATQNPVLRKRLDITKSAERLANYFQVIKADLTTFGRITAHPDIHDLNINNLITINDDISKYTGIKHA